MRCKLILAGALIAFRCMAQLTGTIDGTVLDETGAAVSAATLALTETGTGLTRTSPASVEGYFRFIELRPGSYAITVKASGFSELKLEGLELTLGQQMTIRPVLKVGAVSEQIEVTGTPPPVTTSSSSIAHLVDSRRIVELPLNGRNALQLVSLVPGALPAGDAGQFGVRQSTFQINGGRARDMNFTLDGGVNMNTYHGIAGEYPNPDALQEFAVNTRTYNASAGAGTSMVTAVTRSGSNEFHGAAFEFLRNTNLDARSFFSAKKPAFKRNQFGASLGGPIVRNKTFFFASYQGTTERGSPSERRYRSLTTLERSGDFSQSTKVIRDPLTNQPFPRNTLPSTRIQPFASRIVESDLPAANSGDQFYNFAVAQKLDQTQLIAKVDHQWSASDRTSFRYFLNNLPQTGIGSNNIISNEFLNELPTRMQSWNLSHTHIFSPNVLFEGRATYNRNTFGVKHLRLFSFKALGLAINEDNSVLDYGLTPQSQLIVSGYFNNQPFVPSRFAAPATNAQATLSWMRGRHSLQFGFEVYRNRLNEIANWLTGGQLSFNGNASGDAAADFLLGRFITYRQIMPTVSRLRQTLPSLYVQDDFKVSRRLTVNLGLRWDPFFGWNSENHALGLLAPGKQSTMFPNMTRGLLYPGDDGLPESIVGARWSNLAPRAGIAWDVFGTGKTSIRAGFGIYYVTMRASINLNRFPLIQPFTADVTVNAGDTNNIFERAPFYGVNPFPRPSVENLEELKRMPFTPTMGHTSFGLPFKTPSDSQWSFSIQQALGGNAALDAAYVGSSSSHMFTSVERNYARFIHGQSAAGNIQSRRLFPQIGPVNEVRDILSSNHHALQVSVNKRYSAGFTVLGSYTWSKSLGVVGGQGEGSNGPRDPENYRRDYGPLGGSLTHNFVSSFIWDIPTVGKQAPAWQRWLLGNWQVGSINSIRSGSPFTVRSGRDNSLVGTAQDTADLVGDWRLPDGRSRSEKIARYFDTKAFAQNPLGTFGNLGINNLTGPGSWNIDLVVNRKFKLNEVRYVEFRSSFYNVCNNVNLGNPNSTQSNPTFGQILGTGTQRIIEFALRFAF